ncbi:profilin [Pseudomonas sp. LB3P93]
MTWQNYIDQTLIGTGHISEAAIIGLDGTIWGSSAGFTIIPNEWTSLLKAFTDSATAWKGLRINTEKYLVVKADDRSIYAKKAATGIVSVKTATAVIIGMYGAKVIPGNAAGTVEKLADHLLEQGY